MKIFDLVTLTADPEVRYTQGATPMTIVNIRVASKKTQHVQEGEPDADFFRLTAFGKIADVIAKYCVKGSQIFVEGHIQNNNYEKDGQKVYSDQMIIDSMRLAGGKRAGDNTQAAPQQVAAPVQAPAAPVAYTQPQPVAYGQPVGYGQPVAPAQQPYLQPVAPQPVAQPPVAPQPTVPEMEGFMSVPEGFPQVPVA